MLTLPLTAQLAQFVAALAPGELDSGLFWAACRVAADDLDTAPLAVAAQQAGLSASRAQVIIVEATAHIALRRTEHERAGAG